MLFTKYLGEVLDVLTAFRKAKLKRQNNHLFTKITVLTTVTKRIISLIIEVYFNDPLVVKEVRDST